MPEEQIAQAIKHLVEAIHLRDRLRRLPGVPQEAIVAAQAVVAELGAEISQLQVLAGIPKEIAYPAFA